MGSSFKAYMAGVATVAVAIALGFGGGLLIAQRFGSDTAVPEQSKIAKAKQQDTQQPEASATPAAKPVVTETVGAAMNGYPQPSPQDFAPVVSVPQVAINQQAGHHQPAGAAPASAQQQTINPVEQLPRQEVREAAPPAERQVAPPEPRQPEVRESAIAAQPQRKHEKPPLRSERRQTARQRDAAPKPDRRRQNQTAPRDNAAEPADSAEREMSSNAEARASSKQKSRQMRAEERRHVIEEEEQELADSVEITTEYRRRPMGLPFFGLFGR